jgi:hypothetical protein
MASLPPNLVARSVLACSREQAKAFSFGLGMPLDPQNKGNWRSAADEGGHYDLALSL